MPVRQLPSSFTATRDLTLAGVSVARGATVSTHDAVAALGRKLSVVVSRGWLVPAVTQYVQTARRAITWDKQRHFPPTYYNPGETRSIQ